MTFLADVIVAFEEVEERKRINPEDKAIPEHAEIGYDIDIVAQQNPPHPNKFPLHDAHGIIAGYRDPSLTLDEKAAMRKYMDTTFNPSMPYAFDNLIDVGLNELWPEDKKRVFCSAYVLLVHLMGRGLKRLLEVGFPEHWFIDDKTVGLVRPLDLEEHFVNSNWSKIYHI